MTAATATAGHWARLTALLQSTRRAVLFAAAGVGAAASYAFWPRHSRRQNLAPDLLVDPSLSIDESVFSSSEWIEWAETNLSARELALVKLARSADRGRPVERVPASC